MSVADGSGRHVLIGVCGGIAAYKMATVVSRLVQRGDRVTVAMTASATRFIGAQTFEALSGRAVLTESWTVIDQPASQHVALASDTDAFLIAPCTMHTMARLVQGLADDAVTLLAASVDRVQTPVLVAPAMNDVMYRQPAVQRNVQQLRSDGFTIVEPVEGWQACRTQGVGRLPEPEALLLALDNALS